MPKHRSYAIEFKRQVVQAHLAGETLHGLAKRNLVRIWVSKYEAGSFDDDRSAIPGRSNSPMVLPTTEKNEPQAGAVAATGRALSRTCVRCIRRRSEGSS
jgi:transposase-like protein